MLSSVACSPRAACSRHGRGRRASRHTAQTCRFLCLAPWLVFAVPVYKRGGLQLRWGMATLGGPAKRAVRATTCLARLRSLTPSKLLSLSSAQKKKKVKRVVLTSTLVLTSHNSLNLFFAPPAKQARSAQQQQLAANTPWRCWFKPQRHAGEFSVGSYEHSGGWRHNHKQKTIG